jgi:uncharacterized protein YegJ (DUF2314 family)
MTTYSLDDAESVAAEFPETFFIPPRQEREQVQVGDLVKLIFRIEIGNECSVERMWVAVTKKTKSRGFVGSLDNDPYCTDTIKSGMEVAFGPEHIIEIQR